MPKHARVVYSSSEPCISAGAGGKHTDRLGEYGIVAIAAVRFTQLGLGAAPASSMRVSPTVSPEAVGADELRRGTCPVRMERRPGEERLPVKNDALVNALGKTDS